MLKKNDYIPLYEQLRKILRTQILNGHYKEGDMLPSESHLMKEYDITRTTIRKAIHALSQEGLVQQVHGKGTFVRIKEVKRTIWNFQGFSNLARNRNEEPVSKVIEHTIKKGAKGLYLKLIRLRGMNKDGITTWMTLDHSELPLDIFPGLDKYNFENQSLYEVLEKNFQCPPHHVDLEITPIISNQKLNTLFEIDGDFPLLKANGIVFNKEGDEIEQIEVVYAPHFTFKMSQVI
ncbi:GntR family transcriptional regulator [Pullulanibacillus camelliae]|uniref:GntR family transcriptional regulator n=1 Tax=Pullulanibacillus camelliae TaxID=1707096 RepID=A0A8J2YMM1_9BACL|nr:GntR family transcriptional regulator [Pullulanibacillus camelliae]GGE54745.1 GntR family transcriptional regulator [Pullulanibacillus camelliae]